MVKAVWNPGILTPHPVLFPSDYSAFWVNNLQHFSGVPAANFPTLSLLGTELNSNITRGLPDPIHPHLPSSKIGMIYCKPGPSRSGLSPWEGPHLSSFCGQKHPYRRQETAKRGWHFTVWANYLISLSLSFLLCNLSITIPTQSWECLHIVDTQQMSISASAPQPHFQGCTINTPLRFSSQTTV